jgi:hypothetical protein
MNGSPKCEFERTDPRGHLVQQLRRQLGSWEATSAEKAVVFSSGAAAINRLLPGGGLCRGMLVEWLGGEGSRAVEQKSRRAAEQQSKNYCSPALPLFCSFSAATLSLLGAREACREGGELVVIDRRQTFYPPAAAAWGIDLNRLIVVRPHTARDELWAAVESLRSPAVAAVWASIERLDHRAFRRLQLAAQAGRTLGLLLRPYSARGQPSWADLRLAVEARQADRETRRQGDRLVQKFSLSPPLRSAELAASLVSLSGSLRRVQVRVLRSRSGQPGHSVMLEIDDTIHDVREMSSQHDTHPLPVVTELADPASRSMSARA